MNIDISKPSTTNVICLGIAAVGALYAFFTKKKVDKVCKRLDTTIDDLSDKDMTIDISKEIVDAAVKERVDKEVRVMVPSACRQAIKEATGVFKEEVTREINAQYNDIKGEVAREVKQKVGNIDLNDVKKQVIADARAEADKTFRNELDSELARFNSNLTSIGEIYTSIEKAFKEHR